MHRMCGALPENLYWAEIMLQERTDALHMECAGQGHARCHMGTGAQRARGWGAMPGRGCARSGRAPGWTRPRRARPRRARCAGTRPGPACSLRPQMLLRQPPVRLPLHATYQQARCSVPLAAEHGASQATPAQPVIAGLRAGWVNAMHTP